MESPLAAQENISAIQWKIANDTWEMGVVEVGVCFFHNEALEVLKGRGGDTRSLRKRALGGCRSSAAASGLPRGASVCLFFCFFFLVFGFRFFGVSGIHWQLTALA